MNNSIHKNAQTVGDEYSLSGLLNHEDINCIEIPIIQRDYAQGRISKQDIRDRFLKSIFKDMHKGKALKLDFIYGTIENKTFIPLDGQQRLTTLFLLYWYIALTENKTEEFLDIFKEQNKETEKARFTYTTRASATEFCDALVGNIEELREVHQNDGGSEWTPSTMIKNRAWYFSIWDTDSTIAGMLVMLDDIHKKYSKYKEEGMSFFSNLEKITFLFIDLEKFTLTDDLYIKMNARGKLLTPFENFKALFEKKIKKEEWGIDEFSRNIDGKWTDLFWKLALLIKDNETQQIDVRKFDTSFMQCITTVAMILIALRKQHASDKEGHLRIQDLHNPNNPDLDYKPDPVQPSDFVSEIEYQLFVNTLDKYHKLGNKTLIDIEWWDLLKKTTSIFTIFLAEDITYQQRALFYAQTAYLIRTSHPEDHDYSNDNDFYCWMRVARNITQASFIGTASTNFIDTINILTELLDKMGKKNIYHFLASHEDIRHEKIERRGYEIVKHERRKARILIENNLINDKQNIIFKLEDINFCRSDIRFPLYCIDSDEQKTNLSNNDVEYLKKVKEAIEKCMNEKVTGDFRRALLGVSEQTDADSIDEAKKWYYKHKWPIDEHPVNKFKNRWEEQHGNTSDKPWEKWEQKCEFAYKFYLLDKLDSLREFSNSTDTRGRIHENRKYVRILIDELIAHDYSWEKVINNYSHSPEFKKSDIWIQQIITDEKYLGDDRWCGIILLSHDNNANALIVLHGNNFSKRNFEVYSLSAHKN